MKISDGSFTIVIVGNWNPYILSPHWVAKYLFKDPKLTIEFTYNRGLPQRYTSKELGIRILPESERVTFVSTKYDDLTLSKMNDIACELLGLLSYTPISSFGINFRFDEVANDELVKIIKLPHGDLINESGYQTNYHGFKTGIIGENRLINLTAGIIKDVVSFDFNFHYEVKNASEAKNNIKDEVIKNKLFAEKFMDKIYNVKYNDATGE